MATNLRWLQAVTQLSLTQTSNNHRFAISSWSSVRPGKLGVDGRGGSCDLVSREGGCCLFGLMKVGLQPVAILDLLPQQLHLLSSNTPG